jgi:hypothetical protein
MSNVFKIPESMSDKYHGAGHAIVSVTGGQVVNLVYLSDVIKDYDDEDGFDAFAAALDDERLGPSVRLLQSTGEVFAGMCSCWEFIEL